MKPWYPTLCLVLLVSCKSEIGAHDSPASKGEEITFIVHGPVHPNQLSGDHFFRFVVQNGDHPERTIWIPVMDQSTTDAVCGTVAAGIEDSPVFSTCFTGGQPLETMSSVRATSRGPETTASFVLPPPWHLVSVTVERRDRDDGPRVLDMSQVEVCRDGHPLPNTDLPTSALKATSSR